MTKRGAVALLMVLLAACGRPSRETVDLVRSIVTDADRPGIAYVYSVQSEGPRVEVRIQIEDSLRYSERLVVDGKIVVQRIVRDDSVAIRVLEPRMFEGLDELAARQRAPARRALLERRWVVDPVGAPPLAATVPGRASGEPLLDALNVAAYVREAAGQGAARFDPDSLTYSPEDDPFPAPDETVGEIRYDVTPPPLPTRATDRQLPVTAHFRQLAIYVSGGKLVRVEERISIDGHPDVRRARERGNESLLAMVQLIRDGKGPEVIRERTMRWEIVSEDGQGRVAFPRIAVRGDLGIASARGDA